MQTGRQALKPPQLRLFLSAKYGAAGIFILFSLMSSAVPAGAAGRYEIVGTGDCDRIVSGGLPEGWRPQPYRGKPQPVIEKTDGFCYIRLLSSGDTAYGVKKDIRVNLTRYPYLNWRWKAMRLPRGGDIRKREKDDQALQLYVSFASGRVFGSLISPAIAYIWDNEAPRGLKVKSPQPILGSVRYVVVRNGTDGTGRWHTEKRNVYADYQELIAAGRSVPAIVEGVLLFINTHKTKSDAEGCIGNIFFSGE
jgi:hypothetical protein